MASNDDIREFDVYLGHVNRLVERRQAVTTTYISVNVALTGAMAFLLSGPHAATNVATLLLLCAGVIAATFWRRIIGQYRVLLNWWYGQLRALEMATPYSRKLIYKGDMKSCTGATRARTSGAQSRWGWRITRSA